jgi:hypothetical protein
MGQLCCRAHKNSKKQEEEEHQLITTTKNSLGYSWEQCASVPNKIDRANINKKDFWIRDRVNEFIVRKPGQVLGEQFIIENCTNCDFYILDHSDTITIDDCKNCRFFIGPIMSSIFIRACEECKFGAIACQQFRTRDCKNLDVLLYCQTRPIIETTTNLRVGCFNAFYFELVNQFSFAKLSVFNNIWSVFHDFTPNSDFTTNYSLLPLGTRYTEFMKPISEVCPEVLSTAQEEQFLMEGQILVPQTLPANYDCGSSKCILFLPGYSGDALQFTRFFYASKKTKELQAFIARSRECKFTQNDVKHIFRNSNQKESSVQKIMKLVSNGASIVFKISGQDSDSLIRHCLSNVNASAYYCAQGDEENNNILNFVFSVQDI